MSSVRPTGRFSPSNRSNMPSGALANRVEAKNTSAEASDPVWAR